MDIKINGVEFADVDLLDADMIEAFECGRKEYLRKLDEIQHGRGQDFAVYIRSYCEITRAWIDRCFGEGAGDEVFCGGDSLRTALIVIGDMTNAFYASMADTKQLSNEINAKISATVSELNSPEQRRQPVKGLPPAASPNRKHRNRGRKHVGPYDPERVNRHEYSAGSPAD